MGKDYGGRIMAFAKRSVFIAALTMSAALIGTAAEAAPVVTYTWTTTSEGFGDHVSAPSSATFEVPLSDVLAGVIPQSDISNIELTYPGLSFDSAATSSIGSDFAAFVDPTTGAFVFHDDTQGLAVIAFAGTDINAATTFLSIPVDNPVSGSVADQFNALNDGDPFAGFPNSWFLDREFSCAHSRSRTLHMGHDVARFFSAGLWGLSGVPKKRRSRQSGQSLRLALHEIEDQTGTALTRAAPRLKCATHVGGSPSRPTGLTGQVRTDKVPRDQQIADSRQARHALRPNKTSE